MKNNLTVQYSKSFFKRWCLTIALLCSLTTISVAQTTYWWNDAVFYEVFVRSFKDSDGDGQGDLKGLMSKLDYLNDGDSTTQTDLGVTGGYFTSTAITYPCVPTANSKTMTFTAPNCSGGSGTSNFSTITKFFTDAGNTGASWFG